MKYYHVTSFEDYHSILKTGLHGQNVGEIFVMTDKVAAASIAINQCGYRDYALLEIDSKGITGKVKQDCVAELTRKYQRIVCQDVIEPKYIKFKGMYKVAQRSAIDIAIDLGIVISDEMEREMEEEQRKANKAIEEYKLKNCLL
jgi:hypothetical protein